MFPFISKLLDNLNDTWCDSILDSGVLPHAVLRVLIRRELRRRLDEITPPFPDKVIATVSAKGNPSLKAKLEEMASPKIALLPGVLAPISRWSETLAYKMNFFETVRHQPIAIETDAANRQNYEIATGIMANMLGPRIKYSCSYYPTGNESLGEAEEKMLDLYIERLGLEAGMRFLDLGCGWGAAVLYFAEKIPGMEVVGFSNSRTQKEYIDARAYELGLMNLRIITGNCTDYEFERDYFDRALSVELFEHMKNYEGLMAKMSRALRPGGQLLVHHFCHRTTPYHYEDGWMARTFFTGGTMPSSDLLLYFQKDLVIKKHWWINGYHYSKSLEHWLENTMARRERMMPHLVKTYGEEKAVVWHNRWQIFHLASSEMFKTDGGDTWGVTHALFEKPDMEMQVFGLQAV
ncbi:S-adenosyl-L-methionine-dependent methyltransferase [Neurospora crassa]|uniref:SAM-dependent methyltransferase n=2 Tax=Neurospora crassa TaxID=5141 RepID=A7UWZ0_NEUCR|nr:SAM-dependent methyltransferase [Neurospora crassa OR74A]EDO65435.1 SAM-dependent methyltransferase [Neurospora crassa OR74A]KHE79990.1 S-adenosyl-L-methionine-dependent methyltransferase [Neurospora crassa]CAD70972.1 related to coclaurine N-methyltransferase [Neurospora crassa]|eukprot:XP_001728526.1 SAM-dependent methyltransferase [Neurospora crassa OR74A]